MKKHRAKPVPEAAGQTPVPEATDASAGVAESAPPADGTAPPAEATAPPAEAAAPPAGAELPDPSAAGAPAAPATDAHAVLEAQVAEWRDRALRAAADLENFRRRALREREEANTRGRVEVLSGVVDVVDDLARVAHLDPAQTPIEALHEGVGLVERKFLAVLERSGLERLDPMGEPFDPNLHEAVTMLPAQSSEGEGRVGAVYQAGYRLRGTLLRPARVAVLKWTAPADADLAN